MTQLAPLKILLVEDDEDDYLLTQELINEIPNEIGLIERAVLQFELEWVKTYESALETISQNRYDVVLVDYELGAHSGLDILRQIVEQGHQTPMIFFTASSSYAIDMAASELGAANYLNKDEVSSRILERSIRYAVTSAVKHRQNINLLQQELEILRTSCQKANELQRKLEIFKLHLCQTNEDLQPLEDVILLLRQLHDACCLSTKGHAAER